MAATAGAFSLVTVKPGLTATARSMNRRTAAYCSIAAGSTMRDSPGMASRSSPLRWLGSGGAGRPGTGYSCSPETCRVARLVTTILIPGAVRSRSATIGAAETTCSKLSSTSSTVLSRSQSASVSATGRAVPSDDADRAGDPGGDQHRVADRLERHEEHAVREVVRDAGGELERQSRLARAARPGQREQPGRAEQGRGLGQLGVATDEGRQLRRQVVGMGVGCPRRGELGRQPVDDDLDQVDRRQQVLEAEGAQITQRDAGWQVRRQQPARRVGHEDLAAVGDRRDARRLVDVDADHPAAAGSRLRPARIRRCGAPSAPGHRRRRATASPCRARWPAIAAASAEVARPNVTKNESPSVPCSIPPLRLPRRAQERAVALEDHAVALGAERLLELRRTFDVAEQEGDGAARDGVGLGHPCAVVGVSGGSLRSARAAAMRALAGSRARRVALRAGRLRSPTTRAPGRSSARPR